MQKAIEIQGASEIDVDFDKELKSLVQRGALLKNEGQGSRKALMNNNPDDGITEGQHSGNCTMHHRLCTGTGAGTQQGAA